MSQILDERMCAWFPEAQRHDALLSACYGVEDEGVYYRDDRQPVFSQDLKPNGIFRSVVRLHIYWPHSQDGFGTGWLLRDDLICTAAHNIYSRESGHLACSITVSVGCGINIPAAEIQHRVAIKAVFPYVWRFMNGRLYDFAILQVGSRFHDVEPFKYMSTPPHGSESLGIVGYPIDKTPDATGAYKEFKEVNWNTHKSDGFLKHMISTFNGSSGSPVLLQRRDSYVVIATHVRRNDIKQCNYAIPIGTTMVNSLDDIIRWLFGITWPPGWKVRDELQIHCRPISPIATTKSRRQHDRSRRFRGSQRSTRRRKG